MPEKRLLTCDFCGERVTRVRRVALDRDYDRLGGRHALRYACPSCSQKKEQERERAAVDAPPKSF